MWELIVIVGIAVSVMACGVFPVLYQIRGENNPSPWTYSSEEKMFEGITNEAATQTSVNVVTPTTVPEFSIPTFDRTNMQESIPSEESMNNIEKLLEETYEAMATEQDFPSFEEAVVTVQDDAPVAETNELAPLEEIRIMTDEQYEAIRTNFGKRVADIITCTPYQGCSGTQVMIGTFLKDGNRLSFDQEWVELINDFKEAINGEIIVVKGNFLPNGTFFVQHWDDPMMIEAGYSTFDWESWQAQ